MRHPTRTRLALPVLCFAALCACPAQADWPTYRGDAGRTGYRDGELAVNLALSWVHTAAHPPQSAWPRSDRMTFDRAYQVVAAGELAFYGGSVDGVVSALDVKTGRVAWRFTTDGPIRFAPAVWRDRLFVASDDGFLYALAAADGRLLWKQRGGPDHSAVLGNQRLVSLWPARGGPVVADDVVYFGAGIWPSEGIFLYALAAESGRVLWCNRDSGSLYMPQPHGGANAVSGVAAQGYLAVSGDLLLVPTGRAVPAAFDRRTGELRYFHLQRFGQEGGAEIVAAGPLFYNSGHAFLAADGDKVLRVGPGDLVAGPDFLVRSGAKGVELGSVAASTSPDRKGVPTAAFEIRPDAVLGDTGSTTALIAVGERIVCGGEGGIRVIARNAAAGAKPVFEAALEGTVRGLAAADGRLFASTDRGRIYCFQPTEAAQQVQVQVPAEPPAVTLAERSADHWGEAADAILRASGVLRGYCVDLGCGDGRLAEQLALRSELMIYALDGDPEMVRTARQRLTDAGLYGSRVIVQQRQPGDTGYPSCFADLVVSGRSVEQGAEAVRNARSWGATTARALAGRGQEEGQADREAAHDAFPIAEEAGRIQRPSGGVLAVGRPDALRVERRGELPGAGSWTHQYADAANTLCSADTRLRGSLRMRWFRDVDFDLPSRHGRAPAPLYDRGRLFHEGLDGIAAVDAYNGRELWRYAIPGLLQAYDGDELMGTAGVGGNACLHGDALFVRDRGRCLRLDPATGQLTAEFTAPPRPDGLPGTWGYLAAGDGIVFGSVADDQHIVTYRYVASSGDMSRLLTESQRLFALDAQTGQLLWQVSARHSLRHNAIAIAGGRVYLIDRPLALFDRQKKSQDREHPAGRLIALDARTGQVVWERGEDIYGTLLAASQQQGVLWMGYQPTRFRLDSEAGGRMAAFRLADGERLWDIAAEYASRPMIRGDIVYAQGGAWKLGSGEPVPFDFSRSYGCGILAASQDLMVYRSATLGYYDFASARSQDYGGIRPGCWINAIPAGGLVLLPDASAGCRCSYLNQAWIALAPRED